MGGKPEVVVQRDFVTGVNHKQKKTNKICHNLIFKHQKNQEQQSINLLSLVL
jgi:hypothetical protein